jgi:hypothetical protein
MIRLFLEDRQRREEEVADERRWREEVFAKNSISEKRRSESRYGCYLSWSKSPSNRRRHPRERRERTTK